MEKLQLIILNAGIENLNSAMREDIEVILEKIQCLQLSFEVQDEKTRAMISDLHQKVNSLLATEARTQIQKIQSLEKDSQPVKRAS